jgi:ABC-type Zn2+ transport system substrate-binding protein/surface adhesin
VAQALLSSVEAEVLALVGVTLAALVIAAMFALSGARVVLVDFVVLHPSDAHTVTFDRFMVSVHREREREKERERHRHRHTHTHCYVHWRGHRHTHTHTL